MHHSENKKRNGYGLYHTMKIMETFSEKRYATLFFTAIIKPKITDKEIKCQD